jgi:glutathione S-transferase
MGEHFTVADAYLFVILRWCEMAQIPLGKFPVLASYRAKIAARPAVQAAMREERLKL